MGDRQVKRQLLQVLIPNTQELSDIRLRFILDRWSSSGSYKIPPQINLKVTQHLLQFFFGSIGIQPLEIQPAFLKLNSWSPGGGFYSYYNHPRINLVLREICKKKTKFLGTKGINAF